MACPVCFGGEDAAARESLNAGIGVLMGVTTIVLACFARLFFTLARRSREAAHLVQPVRLKADTTIEAAQ
jgi:hypothetical protein